ncbi:MAG: type I restriction endonuclease subunit R [Candidatus Altiarchaeota archaeon]|nr:type I restriction endonuclease subunit R [Candidatus Altiarchaeota archaeon]
MARYITESDVEEAALEILEEMGYAVVYGPDIAFDGPEPERKSYQNVVLVDRLKKAVDRLNPDVSRDAREEAVRRVLRLEGIDLISANTCFHSYLTDGVAVECKKGGEDRPDIVRLFDHRDAENNEFLAVNQYTVTEGKYNRRPDIVLFVNGIPMAVIELKNPADEDATIWSAYNQLQTYKKEIASLMSYNEFLVASDGTDARVGTISSGREWFMPWKTFDGKTTAKKNVPQLEVLLKGMFEKERFLDLAKNYVTFKKEPKKTIKALAGYHQYRAVNEAVKRTVLATKSDRRCGVVWHTQGSGKSLTMVFYAGKLVLNRELDNPTIVVLTDRNDLDDQLFNTFGSCIDILRQKPVQASSRENLRSRLKVASGGIVFTTIQKFFPKEKSDAYPVLSERRNIVVIADEAHRSQYDFIDGFARHMRDALPNASFIGFTGTPIELSDKSTPAVFGKYIDIYDIEQAVEDGATVRIFYEGRLAKLALKESERPRIDPDFEDVTEQEETYLKEKLKSRWARLEAVVGSERRLKLLAEDFVRHYELRQASMQGKAMIVCMSRRICIELYKEITRLRPEWHGKDDSVGILKIIMTGSASDPLKWQEHIRNKRRRRALGDRFKEPGDPLKIVIVRDMWLTGFDVPILNTLYLDKPMKGHTLMQAIARVNRKYKDKPGGLVVDYLGVADELKKALGNYTKSGGKGKPSYDIEEAVLIMQEKYEIVANMFAGFDYKKWLKGKSRDRLAAILPASEHILKQRDGKERYLKYVTDLSRAFALSGGHEETTKIRDEVGFFQAVRGNIAKVSSPSGKTEDDLDTAIRQIVSRAVASDEVIDIFKAAGLKKPDVSILSDEFLAEINGMEYKNLALEALKKLLNDEIKARSKNNIVEARTFSAMLEETVRRYQNRSIEAAQVIEELIKIAKDMREARKRGEDLNLSDDELAFYDALADNESAKEVLGDDTLKKIAKELTVMVKQNTSIDWTLRESVRSKLKVLVKRLLRKYGYPPDKQQRATELVLEQAELVSKNWVSV